MVGPTGDAATPSADSKRVPSFTPKIRVVPLASSDNPWGPVSASDIMFYRQWTIRLVSMTLLIPKIPRANRGAQVPYRDNLDQWTQIPINCEDLPLAHGFVSEEVDTVIGVPVTLDTCTCPSRTLQFEVEQNTYAHIMALHITGSALSILPNTICKAIATEWLGLASRETELYCPDELDLDDRQIIFTFMGEDNTTVDFRCTASRFLRGGWRERHKRGWAVPIESQPVHPTEPRQWLLGQVEFHRFYHPHAGSRD